MPSVFISYRRDDTSGHAGRLADALGARFGRRRVFMDIDAISPGVDFEERINQALASCDAALVLIGDDWLTLRTPDGRRRLDDPEDFVRKEAAAALARPGVTVVPVLVEGAKMPPADRLPPDIAALARRHAFELSDTRWRYDVGRLADLVDDAARRGPVGRLAHRLPRLPWRVVGLVAVAVAAAVVAAVLVAGGGGSSPDSAARIAACERHHGLTRPSEQRATQPGESQIERPPEAGADFKQSTFASCTWPPAPGSDPDGFGTITVTEADGPGDAEASGRDFADRIESSCRRLRLAYSFSSMGGFDRLAPFTARPGQIWAPRPGGFGPIATSGLLNLPFAPLRDEVTVLRNATFRLDSARCEA